MLIDHDRSTMYASSNSTGDHPAVDLLTNILKIMAGLDSLYIYGHRQGCRDWILRDDVVGESSPGC